ncbi:MAG: ABC transporter ATP-binding protein [Solobacterium sp.]|nr:ABC transporter ATP-binding protein [Solobacterium sp.]
MIIVKNLTVKFNDFLALNDLSLEIREGEKFVIIGPSGAGKTTFLRALAGLNGEYEGSILIHGKELRTLSSAERKTAMIFPDAALFPHTRVKDNITYGLKKIGYTKAEIDAMCKETAELLHIEHLLERYPESLSSGEKQRAGIARAIVRKPEIMLLDEPFSNLDKRLKDELKDELLRLQEDLHMTMVMITHDQTEAMNIADRILLLNQGRMVSCDTPQKLYEKPRNLFTAQFLGNIAINTWHLQEGDVFFGKQISGERIAAVRPEDLRICDQGEPCRIFETERYDDRWLLKGQISFGPVQIIADQLPDGREVCLQLRRSFYSFDTNRGDSMND